MEHVYYPHRLYSHHTHTHTRLMALCPGLPGWARTRKVKPIWILVKQETVSGSGIGWTICKSAPRSRPITTPTPHCSVFYRPDALPAAQPTASKHWRVNNTCCINGLPKFNQTLHDFFAIAQELFVIVIFCLVAVSCPAWHRLIVCSVVSSNLFHRPLW